MYTVEYHKRALKDIQKLKQNNLGNKARQLVDLIKENPFQNPPPYEKLIGDLSGLYSRRINIQHRLIYQVIEDSKTVKVLSLWSHYETV
ncbi:MAG: Txe/YoeB family addiction module toxin [Clostridiales bacterium]|nr:Txe/YoeB family addiction module toxin [Clostridiales bacterium]